MDDEQYRQAREAIEQPLCLYEKALQYGYFKCRHGQKMVLGERESMHCKDCFAYNNCQTFYSHTLSASGFALGAAQLPVHLTFNKAMKVQIGGLLGAMQLLDGEISMESQGTGISVIPDVYSCLIRLENKYGKLQELDYSSVMQQVQKFSLRKGRRRSKQDQD